VQGSGDKSLTDFYQEAQQLLGKPNISLDHGNIFGCRRYYA